MSGTACVTCHMPSVPATPEMRFTNHWIGVYAQANVLVPANASHTLPPLVLQPTAAGSLRAPNDPSTLEPLFQEAVDRQRKLGGPKLAQSLTTLGLFFKETGNLDAAERPLRQALELESTGQSTEALMGAVELGQLLQSIGKKREAIQLFRHASTGPDARAAALSYENLARLDPANAALYYERAVAAEEKAWGKAPRVATQWSNLALALRAKGEVGKAEVALRRALEIQENSLGPSHYQTAASLSNLGSVLQSLGEWNEAEALEREAFMIFEERLPHSLELAAACANLAGLLGAKGDHAGAVSFWRLAIANDEAAGGGESLQVAADLEGLANLLREGKDSAAAEPLLRRALSIYTARLGPDSPRTREIRRSLGFAVQKRPP
jgi:tetratricopeptide (TPR) repeat protein